MNIKKISLFLGLSIVMGLLLISTSFFGYAKEITPTRVAPEECLRFEERIDSSRTKVKNDLDQGIITEEEAFSELKYLDELEKNFNKGILPRDSNSRRDLSNNRDLRHNRMRNEEGFNNRHNRHHRHNYNHNRNEEGSNNFGFCR